MKGKRHAAIRELIKEYEITTQEELITRLREHGLEVTQATISRDIKELRLVKTLSEDGQYRYSEAPVGEVDHSLKFTSIFAQSVVSVDISNSIVVLRCFPGMAPAACASIDTMNFDGIVGTIAGDDTIFALCRTPKDAQEMLNSVKKIIESRK